MFKKEVYIERRKKLKKELKKIKQIFSRFDDNAIRYCHWKSNEHLTAAMEGKTDLDLLVKEEDKEKFKKLLTGTRYGVTQAAPFLPRLLLPKNRSK